jgi:hypothetical protein
VTELGSVTEGRPGPARHSRTPGFRPSVYVFMGDFSKKKKKLLCAFVCLSLGLKKPGDFTVSEGHGYPLVESNLGLGYPSFLLMHPGEEVASELHL